MKYKCKNCGGWQGLHHYKTMQCPVGGVEAQDVRKQEYMDTVYQEEEVDISELEARIERLEAQVLSLLDAVPSARRDR